MKKLLICACLLFGAMQAQAQDIKREGNNFKVERKATTGRKSEATKTDYTYTDTDNKEYTIYISINGRAYILRTSSKTGNEYKKYLSEEIARTICKELNLEYKETTKK